MSGRKNLGFGCVSLTQHAFLKTARNILSLAFDLGISHYDTAPVYGNGYSEKVLGTFIKNKRSQVTITSKCGLGNTGQPSVDVNIALLLNAVKNRLRKPGQGGVIQQPSPLQFRSLGVDYVKASLENSLRNLQTDYIDYYMLHEAMPEFLSADALAYLMEQQQKGSIRNLGVAASYINLMPLEEKDLKGFAVLQYENGPHYKTDGLLNKFHDKKHFYHSSLKSIPLLNKEYSSSGWAGILLNRACKINPSGKVLFSTTKGKRLRENIAAFEKYNALPLQRLNDIVDGFH